MLAAVAIWRMRPRGEAVAELPGWMRTIEKASPAQALMFGALLTVVNLKELAFVVGRGDDRGVGAAPAWQALAVSGVFAALAGAGVAVPVVWSLVAGEGARRPLAAARDWLARNNPIIAAAVMLVIGAMLVGSGIEALEAGIGRLLRVRNPMESIWRFRASEARETGRGGAQDRHLLLGGFEAGALLVDDLLGGAGDEGGVGELGR